MTITFEPVLLDADSGDSVGVLIFRGGALTAVAATLGHWHGELAGSWYVEAVFHPSLSAPREPFADLAALERWIDTQLT